ncbi:cation transport ATPase (apicoplast) [Babesia ovis]|uniref:Cation transport ATPase n=1 Tax=Babesia ovis TaxID=5869 RepID=A0A9W5TE63_BABOV|nr:cation transport ATPase [Babesia ovis]
MRLKTTNIDKTNKVYNLNIIKTYTKIGHTNYKLKIYLNNKNILNKLLKLNIKMSSHSYTNILCYKGFNNKINEEV